MKISAAIILATGISLATVKAIQMQQMAALRESEMTANAMELALM